MLREHPRIQGVWVLNAAIHGIEAPFIEHATGVGLGREIPKGARLLVCGDGFDEHTVKVLWRGNYYFVYARHLNEAGTAR
jgi:hypothetical protein